MTNETEQFPKTIFVCDNTDENVPCDFVADSTAMFHGNNVEYIRADLAPDKEETVSLRDLVKNQQEYGSIRDKRIVCAACRWPDGHIILGIRHFSPDMILSAHLQGYRTIDCREQGFVDQYGNYLTRQEAYQIAEKNGQYNPYEPYTPGTLYSEDLY